MLPGGVQVNTTLATEQVKLTEAPNPEPAARLTVNTAVWGPVWIVRLGSSPPSGVTVICAATWPAIAMRTANRIGIRLITRGGVSTIGLQ